MKRSKDKIIYTITIRNWNKYNSSLKRGHKQTMISNNFCADAKLRTVPVSVRWMFLAVLLEAGNVTRECIEMTERQLRECLESSWSVPRALDTLQELQILSYSKTAPNRIEEKGKEKKGREGKTTPKTEPEQKALVLKDDAEELTQVKHLRSTTWQVYYAEYTKRYRVEPTRNVKVNSCIKNLVARLGADTPDVVRFYLNHPKSFYVSRMHDITCCLVDAEALRTQWLRGKAVTENDIKNYSKNQEQRDLLEAIDRGEV